MALVASLGAGSTKAIEFLFGIPATVLLVGLSLAAVVLSTAAYRQFSPGERLYPAWLMIAAAAVCDAAGLILSHVLSAGMVAEPAGSRLRAGGLVMSGTLRLGFLAAGFAFSLRAYRSAGFLRRLAKPDCVLVGIALIYVLREAWDTFTQVRRGAIVTVPEVLQWPVDPLLCILLAESLVLFRSALGMGDGRVGRTWRAFSTGVFLLVLGDATLWAFNYGYLPWPWNAISWYIWIPAAAAFALAPAYQLEAIFEASASK